MQQEGPEAPTSKKKTKLAPSHESKVHLCTAIGHWIVRGIIKNPLFLKLFLSSAVSWTERWVWVDMKGNTIATNRITGFEGSSTNRITGFEVSSTGAKIGEEVAKRRSRWNQDEV